MIRVGQRPGIKSSIFQDMPGQVDPIPWIDVRKTAKVHKRPFFHCLIDFVGDSRGLHAHAYHAL